MPKPKNPADRFPDPCLPRSDSSNASAPNASMRVRRAYRSGNPTITNTCRRGGSRTAPGAVGRVRVAAQGVGGMQIRARHARLRALYGRGAAVLLPTLRNEQSVAAGLVPAAGKRASVVRSGPCTEAGCGCDARGFKRGHVRARHCRARTVSSERLTGTGRFRPRSCALVASPVPPPTCHTAGGDLAAR